MNDRSKNLGCDLTKVKKNEKMDSGLDLPLV